MHGDTMNCNQHRHNCRDIIVRSGNDVIGKVKLMRLPNKIVKTVIQKPIQRTENKVKNWYRYTFKPWLQKWMRRAVFTGMGAVLIYIVFLAITQEKETIVYNTQAQVVDNMPQRIDELKLKTIHKLAEECETKGIKEPDAAIVLDSNSKMSIGRYMWQIKSVQHYAKTLYGKEINRKEAILIALDEGDIDLDELTMKVMFEVDKGYDEWHNCSKKLGLDRDVAIINSLNQ